MAISFLQVPIGIKVPGNFVEFDTNKAIQGLSLQPYSVLVLGQRLATGTKPAGQIDLVTSASQARKFYGKGSMLFHMIDTFIGQNKGLNKLNVISQDDDGGATDSTGSYEILTAPTADGTLSLYIGDRRYRVAVLDVDTEAAIIAKLISVPGFFGDNPSNTSLVKAYHTTALIIQVGINPSRSAMSSRSLILTLTASAKVNTPEHTESGAYHTCSAL